MTDINNYDDNQQNDETSIEDFLNTEDQIKSDKIEITKKKQERRIHIEKYDNNSGMGDVAPYSITRYFNWGAFLFNWIWGLKYKKFALLLIPLLCIIPYGFIIAIILAFIAGTKGNQWAWEEIQYQNEEDFHNAQKAWVKAWFILAAIALVIAVPILLLNNPNHKDTADSNQKNEKETPTYYNFISTSELKIPQEIYDETDVQDANYELLLSNKYIIYWLRPKNEKTLENKKYIEDEFNKNAAQLKDKFILYPDIKELKTGTDTISDIDIEANCINKNCINKWLYKTCESGYCIINPRGKVYYKTRDKAKVIPKAINLLIKWTEEEQQQQ